MMGIAAALFCLVLFSTHLMGNLYARYSTSGAGSDAARVAQFGDLTLTESGDFDGFTDNEAMIIPGVDLKKDARISFEQSEVSTIVFVELTLTGPWSKAADSDTFSLCGGQVSWRVAEGWTPLEDTAYVYYKNLPPNTPLESAAFIAGDGAITVSDQITEAQMATLYNLDIQISLRASVIQSGGFATAADAWTALSGK